MSTVITYTGDGYQTNFAFSFPYLSSTHVVVFVNDVLMLNPMNYTLSGSTVIFADPPGIDAVVVIKRHTSPTVPLVDFTDGSVLREADLDTAYLHNFYLSQEYADGFAKLINDALLSIGVGQAIVETDPDALITALVNKMLADAAASTLQQAVNDIATNAESIITLGESLQVQLNQLAQGVAANVYLQATAPVPGVGGVPNPIPAGSRWYDTDDNNKPYIYDSTLGWLSIEDPRIGQAVADISVLQTDVAGNTTAIVNEASARSTADSAFATTLALLGAQNAGATAFILNSNTVKIDTDGGDTVATRLAALAAADNGNAAAILSEQTARTNADSAIATDVSNLTTTVGGNTASISTLQSSVNGIQAEYGVTLDVNGFVSGFKLINNGVGSTAFVIAADKFAIANATNPSLIPFEIVGSKINLRGDVSVSGSLLVNGSVPGVAIVPGNIGSTQIGTNAIYSTHIAANEVKAVNIEAGAVTAAKINVSTLNAVQANTGNLNVTGALTLNTTGHIKGGQTAFNTGTGFFLGYETSAYKFSIGNSASGNFMTWDGTDLIVRGNLSLGNYTADAVNVLLAANTERLSANSGWLEVKKFAVNKPGTLRVYWTYKVQAWSGSIIQQAGWRVKLDGVVQGAELSSMATTYNSTYREFTTTESSQYITIEYRGAIISGGSPTLPAAYIKDAQVRGYIELGESVVTD